jgi:hypothetical protein
MFSAFEELSCFIMIVMVIVWRIYLIPLIERMVDLLPIGNWHLFVRVV